MDEVRRFFRYSLPGIVCVLELILVLFISNRCLVENAIKSLQGIESLVVVFGLLLGTGGLGYIFAQIYWALYQTPFFEFLHPNGKRALEKVHPEYLLIKKLAIEHSNPKYVEKRLCIKDLTIYETWVIGASFLLSRREINKSVQGILPLAERLVDVTHNLGATFIGTVLATITWLVLYLHALQVDPVLSVEWFPLLKVWLVLPPVELFWSSMIWLVLLPAKFFWSLMIWVVLLFTFGWNYYRTLQKYESLNNSALINLAMSECKWQGRPSVIFFEPWSIRRRKHS